MGRANLPVCYRAHGMPNVANSLPDPKVIKVIHKTLVLMAFFEVCLLLVAIKE
jgi:hypothetical protein